MLLLMDTADMETQETLARRLEVLRDRLHAALDASGGDHLDPVVQRVSTEFDHVLNRLMRKQLGE